MNHSLHLTTATIVEDKGRFLLVEESIDNQPVLNQPAGHVENNETILAAAVRETLEETQWHVELTHAIGVYRYSPLGKNRTYLRVCFAATLKQFDADFPRDSDIINTHWLSAADVLQQKHRWRSPLVGKCLEDYLAGERFTLEAIQDLSLCF